MTPRPPLLRGSPPHAVLLPLTLLLPKAATRCAGVVSVAVRLSGPGVLSVPVGLSGRRVGSVAKVCPRRSSRPLPVRFPALQGARCPRTSTPLPMPRTPTPSALRTHHLHARRGGTVYPLGALPARLTTPHRRPLRRPHSRKDLLLGLLSTRSLPCMIGRQRRAPRCVLAPSLPSRGRPPVAPTATRAVVERGCRTGAMAAGKAFRAKQRRRRHRSLWPPAPHPHSAHRITAARARRCWW